MVSIPAELIHRGPTVHHPSKRSPRTANTWGFWLSMRSQKQTVATASHGELPRLPSRDGIKQRKAEGKGEGKLEGSKDPWEPRDWDIRTYLKKVNP
ncbi:hypothetical protein AVEN_13518-1 [Araneus ventricosus]|uniref:Uncharacterized protein n=1 Tax=Araneus ventricosus TaxID=182803 RepID=A0A4Y2LLP8_ARAVE|nr:hypothetical protein AVEN_13518-1 [Araneus ventricosus]